MKYASIFLIIFIALFSFIKVSESAARGGSSGSRSGSRSSGSRSSGSSSSSSRIRTGFSRIGSSGFRYGSYSGSRFGSSIRRTTYWPVRRVFYGSTYRTTYYNYPVIQNDTDVLPEVVISDKYTKTKLSDTDTTYNCSLSGVSYESCYEPTKTTLVVDDMTDSADGTCCESTITGLPVCCVVSLAEEMSKATVLKHIWVSFVCLIFTLVLFAYRLCR